MKHHDLAAVLLCLAVAVSLGFVDHRVRREQFRAHVLTEYVPSVLAGTSGAPAKYRVLMPYSLGVLTTRVPGDPYVTFLVIELIAIAASLLILYQYLRHWFEPGASLGGVMAVAALIPLTFTNTWAHPDTFPDLALFALGCLLVAKRRDLLFGVVLFVGMFNRETTGFLVLLWAMTRRLEVTPRNLAVLSAYVVVAGGVFTGLRWARGFEHYRMFMLGENLQMLQPLPAGFDPYTRLYGYFWLVLLAVPGWLAFDSARRKGAPQDFGAAVTVSVVYLIVVWLFAAIVETRVLLPLLALLLPAAVAFFAPVRAAIPTRST